MHLKFKLCEGMYIGYSFYQGRRRRRMIYKSGGKKSRRAGLLAKVKFSLVVSQIYVKGGTTREILG